jgi:hypothetical protein
VGKPISQARAEALGAAQRMQAVSQMAQQVALREPAPQAGAAGGARREQYVR